MQHPEPRAKDVPEPEFSGIDSLINVRLDSLAMAWRLVLLPTSSQ